MKLYFGKRKNKSKTDSDLSYKNSETQECNKKYSQDKVYAHGLEKASAYSWLQNVSNSWKILVIGGGWEMILSTRKEQILKHQGYKTLQKYSFQKQNKLYTAGLKLFDGV